MSCLSFHPALTSSSLSCPLFSFPSSLISLSLSYSLPVSSTLLCHCIFSRLLSVSFELLLSSPVFSYHLSYFHLIFSRLLLSSLLISSSLSSLISCIFSLYFSCHLISSGLAISLLSSSPLLSLILSSPLIIAPIHLLSACISLQPSPTLPSGPLSSFPPFSFRTLFIPLSLCVTHIPWIMINVGVY